MMEETVVLKLENYDRLNSKIQMLYENVAMLEDEEYKLKDLLKEANNRIQELKELFLNESIRTWQFKDTPLEELIDISSYKCAISNADTMLEYDFSEDEIVNFIKKKYKEWEDGK